MLQQPEPGDHVIATGEMHPVRPLSEAALCLVRFDWEQDVRMDDRYLRPTEVDELCGRASRARAKRGCQARTTIPRFGGPDAPARLRGCGCGFARDCAPVTAIAGHPRYLDEWLIPFHGRSRASFGRAPSSSTLAVAATQKSPDPTCRPV